MKLVVLNADKPERRLGVMMRELTEEEWFRLVNVYREHKEKFLRYRGRIYEVSSSRFSTGPSPTYSIVEITVIDVEDEKGGEDE